MFDDFFFDILKIIIFRDMDILKEYFEVNEGIENRIYKDIFIFEFLYEL